MHALLGIRCCDISSTAALSAWSSSVGWNLRNSAVTRHGGRRAFFPIPPRAESEASSERNSIEEEDQSAAAGNDKWTLDVTKLFNITQRNLLQLSQQRSDALEELERAKRENELLLARISQLKAEAQVSAGEVDLLQRKLRRNTGVRSTSAQSEVVSLPQEKKRRHLAPASIWSELLLRVDSWALTGNVTLGQASALRDLVRKRDAQAGDAFLNLYDKDDWALSSGLVALLAPNRRGGIHVVHICTEMAPIAQAGSLAAGISKLSQALRKKGHLVEVILPKYSTLDVSSLENLVEIPTALFSYFGGEWFPNKIWTGVFDGIAVTLIDAKHPQKFFERESIYDHEDDFERFTYFCRAALEYILKSGKQPNVLHIHNWQTAAVAPLFWDMYANQGLQNTRILFTCHDFKYQCLQEPSKLSLCGLIPDELHRPDRLQDNSDIGLVNILKGGVIYSNKVTTVSPIYAHDVRQQEHGHGLHMTLIQHAQKFNGILNGIDDSVWNPSVDPLIPSTYSVEDLSGKDECKAAIRKSLKFPDVDNPKPLVVCIAPSFTELDLEPLKEAFRITLSKGAQFVFVGASKIPRIQAVLEDLQRENKDAHFAVQYTESLVHQVMASSDILICPCFFEPSGQWPLVAMKYGTVPVAREIYGVRGSVIDADDVSGKQDATGFNFCSTEVSDMGNALTRALDRLEADPEEWTRLIYNGMQSNHSWDGKCVEAYEAAYYSVCSV